MLRSPGTSALGYCSAMLSTGNRWLSSLFAVGIAAWTVSSAVLGIPHGPGHSIGSMTLVETINNIAFPVWVGAFLWILAALCREAGSWMGRRDRA
jgi:hypothetical protein